MTTADRWLLPDGVEELLPEQAAQAEALRRRLLDLYHSWGYDLVMPPLIEYTDSLLVGLGSDLDLRTFKLTDQLSGRTLGIRADITTQVARIDAHSLHRQGPVRLCYAGSVLHTRPKSPLASRCPIQIGAELYGDQGLAADAEIVLLMLETLRTAGIDEVTLDLGHVGIYRALVAAAGLDEGLEARLFDALQRKASSDLDEVLARIDPQHARALARLGELNGGLEVLDEARRALPPHPAVSAALDQLDEVAATVRARLPGVSLYFDLTELRGYDYHTGLVFAALAPGWGQAIANGGRYDHIGEVFGRARPATGFATDLKALVAAAPAARTRTAILAPYCEAGGTATPLWESIQMLRATGERVVMALPNQPQPEGCDRQLVWRDDQWQVEPL